MLLDVLEISRSSYYKYRKRIDQDYKIYKLIKKEFVKSKKTYGYRRIKDALLDEYGLTLNHKKVQRIMKKYNLHPEYIKRIKFNYSKRHAEGCVRDDHLQRHFNQRGWVTDVTYLIFGNKRAFLSTILDLETRDIVASKISRRNDMDLVIGTLNLALEKIEDPNGLILHSDQGFQYLTQEYQLICAENGILVSMSRKGTPLDNAVIESFHSILKKETLYNNDIKDLDNYIQLVTNWLEFYNTLRIRLKRK